MTDERKERRYVTCHYLMSTKQIDQMLTSGVQFRSKTGDALHSHDLVRAALEADGEVWSFDR